jgi:hypothetical protein
MKSMIVVAALFAVTAAHAQSIVTPYRPFLDEVEARLKEPAGAESNPPSPDLQPAAKVNLTQPSISAECNTRI